MTQKAMAKLVELEDIEEEIGLPLEKFYAMKKSALIWVIHDGKLTNVVYNLFWWDVGNKWLLCYYNPGDCGTSRLKISDYGKTWALTKEELKC